MHKFWVGLFFVSLILLSIVLGQSSSAISQNVVISQVQIGDVSESRFIELYNNSNVPVDITGWRLFQNSKNNGTPNNLLSFQANDLTTHLILKAKAYLLVGSSQFGIDADFLLSKGLGLKSGGHIYLLDNNNIEVDRLGWGEAIKAEGSSPTLFTDANANHILERNMIGENTFVDTDNNLNDFSNSDFRQEYTIGAIDEVVDVCPNIQEIQVLVPTGYLLDNDGNCNLPAIDLCQNIEGDQAVVPSGYILDENNNCQPDICPNIVGGQITLPPDMLIYENSCFPKPMQLKITELLPNPIGSDDGNEFIEIYNPGNSGTNLSNFVLALDSGTPHFYNFPDGSYINQGEYLSFSDDDINFTLTNASGLTVRLTYLGQTIDEAPIYNNAHDGMSWASIEGAWQYTNQPTPGRANLASLIGSSLATMVSTSNLRPCRDGQYRSEETGRCRNIINDVASLVPCAEGQERNPLTNRCRAITAVLGTKDLKPCKAGQERNPETNRCRNVTSKIPKANYAPEQTTSANSDYTSWLVIAGIGAAAIFYCFWEWRVEVQRLFKKLFKIK